jgi:hypothetical protein
MAEQAAHKRTLEELYGTIHIDIPALAAVSGLDTSIIYRAVIGEPISQAEAEAILAALSLNSIHLYTLDEVMIVLYDNTPPTARQIVQYVKSGDIPAQM